MISIDANGRPFLMSRGHLPAKHDRRGLELTVRLRLNFAAAASRIAAEADTSPHPWKRDALALCLEHGVAWDDLVMEDGRSTRGIGDCRQAIIRVLHARHGMPAETIAHYLGCTTGTVKRAIAPRLDAAA